MSGKKGDDEFAEWATVIAIDPGVTTGWSVMAVHPIALASPDYSVLDNVVHHAEGETFSEVEGGESAAAEELAALVNAWPGCAVVIEDFDLRMLLRSKELLSPVRITAALEALLYRDKSLGEVQNTFRQKPGDAKSTCSDERLKAWGYYWPAPRDHARDATRHALLFLRRAKEKPGLRRVAWPHHFGEKA